MGRPRVCTDCPSIYDPTDRGARKGRCPACARTADRARGSREARGYDDAHRTTRAGWQARIDAGEDVRCWRPGCNARITGRRWHLGHADRDRSIIRGPECEHCNLSAAGKASQRTP